MTYLWTVPEGLNSSTVKIRVRMDNSAADYWDVSDAPFSISEATSVHSSAPELGFVLEQNEPNPFNPITTITFVLESEAALVSLLIYDVRGAPVRTLVDGPQPAGRRSVVWNGLDDSGNPMASGIYFYQLQAGDQHSTRKMVLVR